MITIRLTRVRVGTAYEFFLRSCLPPSQNLMPSQTEAKTIKRMSGSFKLVVLRIKCTLLSFYS